MDGALADAEEPSPPRVVRRYRSEPSPLVRDGVLEDGTRILPEGWTKYVSTPSGPQPEGRGWGYGAGWWLFNNHQGIPEDTFLAAGNRGQYLVIVPSMDLVIVRRGEDMVGTRFDIEAFTRDVISAINATDA